MILVFADNHRLALYFMSKLSQKNPELGLTRYTGWKYIPADSVGGSVRGYKDCEIVLLYRWPDHYSTEQIDDLNLLLEIGDLTNKTQHYIDLINK